MNNNWFIRLFDIIHCTKTPHRLFITSLDWPYLHTLLRSTLWNLFKFLIKKCKLVLVTSFNSSLTTESTWPKIDPLHILLLSIKISITIKNGMHFWKYECLVTCKSKLIHKNNHHGSCSFSYHIVIWMTTETEKPIKWSGYISYYLNKVIFCLICIDFE